MDEIDRLALFNDSLERCTAKETFLSRFYELFLNSDPEVARKFSKTGLKRQTKMLRRSLYLVMLTSEGEPTATRDLELLASKHDRQHLDIPPRLYDLWLSCLLQAVAEHDPQFDEATKRAWELTLRVGIDFLVSRY